MSCCDGTVSEETWGPALWDELHRSSSTFDLDSWKKRIPCPLCRAAVDRFSRLRPPDRSGDMPWFRWGVVLHDYVNVELGKEKFGFAAAKVKYGRA